jgi:hypothetical protein
MERKLKPNWWLLYLTVPLMIGLLILEGRLSSPPLVHQIMELGIVVVSFGLMAVWVQANAGALQEEATDRDLWILVSQPGDDESETDTPHPSAGHDQDKERELYPRSGNASRPEAPAWGDLADDLSNSFQLEAGSNKGRYN